MMPARKVTLQLTPLLDLLLIVIFAQFLEMRTAAGRIEAEHRVQLAEVQQSAARERVSARVLAAERQVALELLKDVFAKTRESWEPRLAEIAAASDPGSGIQVEVDRLVRGGVGDIVQHLTTYGEIRKRADLWELYLSDDGVSTISVGQHSKSFRGADPENYAASLVEFLKELPQPKSLVVLVASYGNARFKDRLVMQSGLELAMPLLQKSGPDRTRFEFAVAGYREAPP